MPIQNGTSLAKISSPPKSKARVDFVGLQTLAKTSHKSSGLNTRTNVRLTQTSGNTHSEENFRSRLNSSKRSDPRRGKATGSHAHTDADAPTTFASCTDSSRIRRRICLRYAEHRVRTAPVGVRTSQPPAEMGVWTAGKGVFHGVAGEKSRGRWGRARVYIGASTRRGVLI